MTLLDRHREWSEESRSAVAATAAVAEFSATHLRVGLRGPAGDLVGVASWRLAILADGLAPAEVFERLAGTVARYVRRCTTRLARQAPILVVVPESVVREGRFRAAPGRIGEAPVPEGWAARVAMLTGRRVCLLDDQTTLA